MHYHRLASLLLGAWLSGSVLLLLLPMTATTLTERLIREPEPAAAKLMERHDPKSLAQILHHASQQTLRHVVYRWEWVQIFLGLGLASLLFLSRGGKRYLSVVALLMLGCVVFLHGFISPEIRNLAPSADFAADSEESLPRDRLRALENGYRIIDSVKLVLGLIVAFGLIKSSRKRLRPPSGDQIDPVNYPYDRHINRARG